MLVSFGVASIPEREAALQVTIASIYWQVDRVNVYLNNYSRVPRFLRRKKITVFRSKDFGDLGDAGKFFRIEEGFNLHGDDDLIYPEGYVNYLRSKIEQYERRAVITLHGRNLYQVPIKSYYKDYEELFRCLDDVEEDRFCQIAGTGVLAYHTDTIKPNVRDFPCPNMGDIWFSLLAQKQKVPLLVANHKKSWLKTSPTNGKTIYQKHHRADQLQTSVINSFNDWKIYRL